MCYSTNVANVLWALAELQHPPQDGRLLDDFCLYMHGLLHSQDARTCPNAQEVANALWALARMKHAPPSKVVSAMLYHLVALCQAPGLQPNSQNISNCFLACAELSLDIYHAQVAALLRVLLGLHVTQVDYQHYSNVAWSLAVMGCLQVSMFDALLLQLTTKRKLSGEHAPKAHLHSGKLKKLHSCIRLWSGSSPVKAQTRWRPGPACTQGYKDLHQHLLMSLTTSRGTMSCTMLSHHYGCIQNLSRVVGCTRQTLCCPHMAAMVPRSSSCCSAPHTSSKMDKTGDGYLQEC